MKNHAIQAKTGSDMILDLSILRQESSHKIHLSVSINSEVYEGVGDTSFEALQALRKTLDKQGIRLLCNGASMDVRPSGMMSDMGADTLAYRLIPGKHASITDTVDIFEFDAEKYMEGTVEEQDAYFETWRRSKRTRSYHEPKYSVETVKKESKPAFVFFWGHQPGKSYSCFSQWWPCEFVQNGQTYSSAEQWMMAEKARLFSDSETLGLIMNSKDPREAKAMGRRIVNFSEEIWKTKRISIVKQGNMLKFGQNEELASILLDTNEAILVEASPTDIIWGVGMDVNMKGIDDPNQWRGLNLLGFALMEVRDELRQLRL